MTPQNKPTKENLLKDTEINATFYQITLQFFFSTIFSLILFFVQHFFFDFVKVFQFSLFFGSISWLIFNFKRNKIKIIQKKS